MKRMTDFVQLLVEKHNLSAEDAGRFVQTMTDVLNDSLHYEKQVKIKGLGTFKVIGVNARESVDVNTGRRITIDARDKITFTPENSLKERVNSPFEGFSSVELADGVDFSPIDKKYEEGEAVDEPAPAPEPTEPETKPTEPVAAPVASEPEPVVTPEPEPIVNETEPAVSESEPVASEPEPVASEPVVPEPVSSEPEPAASEPDPEPEQAVENELPEEEEQPEEEAPVETEEESGSSWKKYLLFAATVIILGGLVGAGVFYFLDYKRLRKLETLELMGTKPSTETTQPAATETTNTNAALINNQVKKAEQKEAKAQQQAKSATLTATPTTAKTETKTAAKTETKKEAKAAEKPKPAVSPSKYDSDPRIRTGAYNIIGIEKTVTVRAGQTLSGISRTYLGPGMECYMEAVNPKGELKAGQKVNIPKLQLKKKAKK